MQSWTMPTTDDVLDTAITQHIVNALKTLRSLHSGATEPSEMVAYMLWADTTTGLLKIRDAANAAWIVVSPLAGGSMPRLVVGERLALSASTTLFLPPPAIGVVLKKVILVADTSTSSSSGNEWQFGLQNLTAAAALFSGAVGTFTALGGVGGGEMTADAVYVLTPDQNDDLSADDVLELAITEVGAATTLARVSIFVEYEPR
jgi:hypothetical protein